MRIHQHWHHPNSYAQTLFHCSQEHLIAFNLKKNNAAGLDHSGQPNMLCVSGVGMTLISPETPRPRKLFRQLYLNGHAYTYYLDLKWYRSQSVSLNH
jgi:hypothetical protein